MSIPTHILMGLVIGKTFGNYPVAIIGSLIVDIDHLIPYIKHGVLLNFKKFIQVTTTESDILGGQRNISHGLPIWLLISIIAILIDFKAGTVFSIAYLFHLIVDALDSSEFMPFYPLNKLKILGPVKYLSKHEIVFALSLLAIFAII